VGWVVAVAAWVGVDSGGEVAGVVGFAGEAEAAGNVEVGGEMGVSLGTAVPLGKLQAVNRAATKAMPAMIDILFLCIVIYTCMYS